MKQECAQESEISNMVLEKSRIFLTRNATVVSFERNKKTLQNIYKKKAKHKSSVLEN